MPKKLHNRTTTTPAIRKIIQETIMKKSFYEDHDTLKAHLKRLIYTYECTQRLKVLQGATPYEKVCLYLRSEEGKSSLNPIRLSLGPNT